MLHKVETDDGRTLYYYTEETIRFVIPNDSPWMVEITEKFATKHDIPMSAFAMDMSESLVGTY